MKIAFGVVAVLMLLVAGCTTTERVAVQDQPAVCGFLGEVCKQLTPGQEGEAGLRWVNPKANLTQYNKVLINMVGFYGSDKEKVSPKDEQTLTDAFAKALQEQLATKYQVADQAGPGVIKIEVAVLDAEAATPGLRSITMVVPQMRLLSTGASFATGKFPFAGGAEAAAKLTDSVTGEILAAGVDRRVGGGSIKTAAQWEWGDAENAMKAWAEMITTNMYAYTSGAKKP
jgi:Protein of unknown function (DUF3313)